MEVSTIRQYAEQNLSEAADTAETQHKVARQEIPYLKKEKRIHQQAALAMAIVSAVIPNKSAGYLYRMGQEATLRHQTQERLRDKLGQIRQLERRLRAATFRAQIFTGLMRRARGGDSYASHQARYYGQTTNYRLFVK
ncbi:MAG TPA: hypothetical protein VFT16_03420 [Candidatus Saccharimonadales bacterium]|nr:hypothetical protein [Candidatus Saccharimonadales bacterium]